MLPLDDLRALARHSRRTLRVGLAAWAVVLLAFPLVAAAWTLRPALLVPATYAATAAAGAGLVAFMHAAGRERGAFRRAFREAKRR
jgi:hypothetical protein